MINIRSFTSPNLQMTFMVDQPEVLQQVASHLGLMMGGIAGRTLNLTYRRDIERPQVSCLHAYDPLWSSIL